jgi:hypothetical protein
MRMGPLSCQSLTLLFTRLRACTAVVKPIASIAKNKPDLMLSASIHNQYVGHNLRRKPKTGKNKEMSINKGHSTTEARHIRVVKICSQDFPSNRESSTKPVQLIRMI